MPPVCLQKTLLTFDFGVAVQPETLKLALLDVCAVLQVAPDWCVSLLSPNTPQHAAKATEVGN